MPEHAPLQFINRWWWVLSATVRAGSPMTDVLEKPFSDAVFAEREVRLNMLEGFGRCLKCLLGVVGTRHLSSHMNDCRRK